MGDFQLKSASSFYEGWRISSRLHADATTKTIQTLNIIITGDIPECVVTEIRSVVVDY